MSQENVDVVRQYFAATNRRDFASAMDSYADEVVLAVAGLFPGGTYSGRQAVGEWFGEWFSAFGRDYHFDLLEARDLGERVFAMARHHGSGRASGVRVEATTGYVFTVTAGKIARVELYADPAESLKAVGLQE
jgi:ketosteroid isomerase-like protein